MSKRAIRRGMSKRAAIAASTVLALGGTLAIASTASAAQIPTGSSSDAPYSGSGTASSLWSLSNGITSNLVTAAEIDQAATGAGDTGNTLPATPAISDASGLTNTNVGEIAADWANSSNETYYVGVLTEETGSSSTAQADYNQLAAALPTLAAEYSSELPDLTQLIGLAGYDPTDYPGGLYTIDGDAAVSSAATVTKVGVPTQYTVALKTTGGAVASGEQGYVLPSAFSVSFPKYFSINVGLLGDEIQSSQVSDPPAKDAIGTVTLKSPAVIGYSLGSTDTLTGKVFAVAPTGSGDDPAARAVVRSDDLQPRHTQRLQLPADGFIRRDTRRKRYRPATALERGDVVPGGHLSG